jgi:hypothetical protein
MTAGPWNPKHKVNERVGLCQCDEHDELSDNPKRGQSVRLWMTYSDQYSDFLESDKNGMSDEDRDIAYDESEKYQFEVGSEAYYCDDCYEGQQC